MKIDWDSIWREFEKEAKYITLDGKIQLRTVCVDFGKFVLEKFGKVA